MTKKIDHEAIIAELRHEALSDPHTGWLSDLAHKGLDWSENDEVIMLRHVDGSVDVGHLASVVGVLISEATKPLLSRLEQAEQAVQRVREVAAEYRPSIPEEVLHEVMKDIIRALDGDARRCIECNGTGDVQVRFNHGIQTQDCAVCFGTGDGRG